MICCSVTPCHAHAGKGGPHPPLSRAQCALHMQQRYVAAPGQCWAAGQQRRATCSHSSTCKSTSWDVHVSLLQAPGQRHMYIPDELCCLRLGMVSRHVPQASTIATLVFLLCFIFKDLLMVCSSSQDHAQ